MIQNNISNIHDNLKKCKSLPLLDENEIKYIQNPIGKAIIKKSLDINKKHYSDKLICDICGGSFTRSHKSAHNKTKLHLAYDNMNKKLMKVLLN